MWGCEATGPSRPPGPLSTFVERGNGGEASGVDGDFVIGVGPARLSGEEEAPGAAGGEPAGEQLRGGRRTGLGEQRLHPAADVPQLPGAPPPPREHRPYALGGAQ